MGGAAGRGGGGAGSGGGGATGETEICDAEEGLVVEANGVAFGMFVGGGGAAGIPWRVLESHFGAASPGTARSEAGAEPFCATNGRMVLA